jgi:hypothetical protein
MSRSYRGFLIKTGPSRTGYRAWLSRKGHNWGSQSAHTEADAIAKAKAVIDEAFNRGDVWENPMGGAAKAAIALGVGVAVLAAGIGIAVALEKPAAAQPQPTPPGPKPSTNPTVTVAPGDAGTLTLPSFAGNTHAGVGETLSLQGPTVAGLTGVITAFTSSNPAVVASLPFAPGSGQTLWTMPVLGPGTTKITYTYLDPTDSTGKRMLTGALTVTVLP